MSAAGEVDAVSVSGAADSADVFLVAPDTWRTDAITVSVYQRLAGARVLVSAIADLRAPAYTLDGSTAHIHVASVRGYGVDGFEVTAQRTSGSTTYSNGRFILRTSRGGSPPSVVSDSGTYGGQPMRQGAAGPITAPWVVRLSDGAAAVGTSGNPLHIQQATASNLNATVVQSTATNLKVSAEQATASNLNATVVQSTATNLKVSAEQATASNLKATATQGPAAAISAPWPAQLSDGSTAFGTSTNALTVRGRDQVATYSAASPLVVTGTAVAVKSIAYLFHPSGSTRRVEIRRIIVTWGLGSGATAAVLMRARRITAENGTPGARPGRRSSTTCRTRRPA